MRNKTTFGISFYVKKYKATEGLVPIYVRITVNGQYVDMSIKRKVKAADWDARKCQVRKSAVDGISLNSYLGTIQNRLYECKEELERERRLVTMNAIKNRYTGQDSQSNTLSANPTPNEKPIAAVIDQPIARPYSVSKPEKLVGSNIIPPYSV